MISPFKLNVLINIFSTEYPKNMLLTDSYADAVDETKPFSDIDWIDVTPEIFSEHFEVACCFSPEAMYYVLPAFIQCSITDIGKMELPLDYLFSMMSLERCNKSMLAWKDRRWEKLSLDQYEIVIRWLKWMGTLSELGDSTELIDALNGMKERMSKMV